MISGDLLLRATEKVAFLPTECFTDTVCPSHTRSK